MGGSQSLSQDEIDDLTQRFFASLPKQYIDIGIDGYLLQYSGTNSNAVLNAYSNELVSALPGQVPDFIEKAGTALAGFSAVPHAVGVGALIISMVLQLAFIGTKGPECKENCVSDMLRHIFAEEKASEVRNLIEEYMKRYKMHLRNDFILLEDTRHLERSLSHQLTRLKNSMLVDGHMSSRALKHWANGAAFHAQMLIHMARLQKNITPLFQSAKSAAKSAVDTYQRDMTELLEQYKEYKTTNFRLDAFTDGVETVCFQFYYRICDKCLFYDTDTKRRRKLGVEFCDVSAHHYTDYIFVKHTIIVQLRNYFVDLDRNLADLCNQDGTFEINA